MLFLVVEDHPLYAEALERVILNAFAEARVLQAESIGAARNMVKNNEQLQLVLLDLGLPDTEGFEGLVELRMLRPALPVVIHSAFADANVVHGAIACGAAGFIAKSLSKDGLVAAIRDVLDGNVPLPPDYCPPAVESTSEAHALRRKLGTLTHQQLRVLQLLCLGKINKEAAEDLGIGETTVKAHVSEILRKLGVYSRTQAVLGVSKVIGSDEFRHVFADGWTDVPRSGQCRKALQS